MARRDTSGQLPVPYAILLRMGFTMRPLLPAARCALTAPFHPYRQPCLDPRDPAEPAAVYFLWHFPASHLDRPLTGILPCEARTFLPSGSTSRLHLPRPTSDPIANSDENKRSLARRCPEMQASYGRLLPAGLGLMQEVRSGQAGLGRLRPNKGG